MSGLLEGLARIVGPEHVLVDADLRATYEVDWTRRFSGLSRAVVRPASTAEVAAALGLCDRAGVAVIPQGGNTSLVGGSVPRGGPHGAHDAAPVILSLRRLGGPTEVDRDNLLLRTGAGTTLSSAAGAAAEAGLELGIDLGARDTATLGGMVATNAGGIHVIRHGSMRRRLAGIEAVLADGSIIARMDGLWKDNLGWDLASLLAGSEGTLAVVTGVALRLVPRPAHRVTALVPLPPARLGDAGRLAVDLLRELRAGVSGLEAVELVDRAGMELVTAHCGLAPPPGDPSCGAWLTVEAGADTDPTASLDGALDHASIGPVAVAGDGAGRRRLWEYRERLTEAIAGSGIPHKLDVSVPIGRLPELLATVADVAAEAHPTSRTICFGHLGDGNIHVNVLGPAPNDMAVDEAVLRHVLALGGSISAEHGVGVAKLHMLPEARTAAEIDLARRVKAAFDPNGTLNPGALVP